MAQEMEYDLNGTVYVQRPLVIGQVRQLVALLDGLVIPRGASIPELIDALGGKLMPAVAVALTEKGKSPRDKDIDSLSGELEFTMTPEQLLQVVDDFFGLNPISSIMERIGNLMQNGAGTIGAMENSLKNSSSSSPEETSPVGTSLSGDVPSETQSLS